MNIIDENKYDEIKNILMGCKNINDAEYFADLYIKRNQEAKKLVISLLNGKKYFSNNKDFRSMQKIMEKCNECQTQNEAMDVIREYFPNKDNNNIQYKTLIRIAKSKREIYDKEKELHPKQQQTLFSDYPKQHNLFGGYKSLYVHRDRMPHSGSIVKYCPHQGCGKPYQGTNETKYVICGYDNDIRGYDWIGCQRDWCFLCGKILCKMWVTHQLDVDCNRIHDSECCKKHSIDNKKSYLTDYCQCENKYVRRNLFSMTYE